jgi:hypothetical protein
MDIRRTIKRLLAAQRHRTVLMEEVEDYPGEDLIEKLDRILQSHNIQHVVIYWPAGAKMQTTYDELLLLRDRFGQRKLPKIWVLHESSVAKITKQRFLLKEPGGRSRYLESVARLGVRPIPWDSHDEMFHLVRLLSQELKTK